MPEIVNPPELARAVGFSHGVVAAGGRWLFLAGQTATDGAGQAVAAGDVVGQYEQVLRNLQAVVAAAGGTMAHIVKLTLFVRDRDDYKAHLRALGRVHQAFFGSYYPAMALVEISRFYEDAVLIEIEGIAVLPDEGAG